jgi:hypothetical protein
MSPTPDDRHVDELRRQLNTINANDLTTRLKKALATTRRAGNTRPDGYPTTTPGNGTVATTRGRTIIVDDEHGEPDHVPVTSVEAAVIDRQHHHRDRHLQLTLNAYAALDAAVLNLQRCTRLLDRLDTLTDASTLEPAPGCWAMARIGKWEPIHRTTIIDGEPRSLGRWAYDWVRSTGRLPTTQECQDHHDGKRLRHPTEPSPIPRHPDTPRSSR